MMKNWLLVPRLCSVVILPLKLLAAEATAESDPNAEFAEASQAMLVDGSRDDRQDAILEDSGEGARSEKELPYSSEFSVAPMRAQYQAIYNGKRIGKASLQLLDMADESDIGQFEILYRMKATRGLASFVGANLKEEGRFIWQDEQLVPQYFNHRSKAFLSKRKWHAEFDRTTQQVAGKYKSDEYSFDLREMVLDPLTQFIDSGRRAAQLSGMLPTTKVLQDDSDSPDTSTTEAEPVLAEWSYASVMKGELRQYHFKAYAPSELETKCGEFPSIRVLRTREESPATQEMWYSVGTQWNLARLKIVQRDGDVLDLDLSAMEVAGTHLCGEFEPEDD